MSLDSSLLAHTGLLAGLFEAPAIIVSPAAAIFEGVTDLLLLVVVETIETHATRSSLQWLQALGICIKLTLDTFA